MEKEKKYILMEDILKENLRKEKKMEKELLLILKVTYLKEYIEKEKKMDKENLLIKVEILGKEHG